MYSGEADSEDDDLSTVHQPLTTSQKVDQKEAEFLRTLDSLKSKCFELHKTLDTALRTSGVCKKYTQSPSKRNSAFNSAGIVVRKAPSGSENVDPTPDKSMQMRQRRKSILSPKTRPPDNVLVVKPVVSSKSQTTQVTVESTKKEEKKDVKSPRRARSKLQDFVLLEKQKRAIVRYKQRKKELSERPHLVLLKPKPTSIKPMPSKKNGNSKYSRKMARKRIKISRWMPQTTVPEPFLFTLRDETSPIRNNYSLKFLEKMMEEKREKEEEEMSTLRRQFVANPVPDSTYVSSSNFYVGRLKNTTKTRSNDKLPPPLKLSDKSRSKSEPSLSGRPLHQFHAFRAHPVPISTYIRPTSTNDEERAMKRAQRSIELLTMSREPFGMSDHSIRSHVQYRIRHLPTCYEKKPTFQPSITKSVPDFRLLQMEFANKLQQHREARPPTVTEPFTFHESDFVKHDCDNMHEKPTVVKFKKAAFQPKHAYQQKLNVANNHISTKSSRTASSSSAHTAVTYNA